MLSGNFVHGEFFIDSSAKQSTGRAAFGAWLIISVAVIAICVRSIYHSRLKRTLLADGQNSGAVRLWVISPATTPTEAYELRHVLRKGLARREWTFIFTSLACLLAPLIGAASTLIANRTVVTNAVIRTAPVSGRLVTNEWIGLDEATVEVTSRFDALDKADAPLDQLFDFVPGDNSGWVYVGEQWNNSWHGQCTYTLHPAVNMVVLPTNSTRFQDRTPALGTWLPTWVTANDTDQATWLSGLTDDAFPNKTVVWTDGLMTHVFRNVPSPTDAPRNFNLSLVNFLIHHIGENSEGNFLETAFSSDIHVAECVFENSSPGLKDQASPLGHISDAARNIAKVSDVYLEAVPDCECSVSQIYEPNITASSIAQRPIVHPTAQQMLRYWQAYTSVKDTQNVHVVQRQLSISQPIVQIRLTALVATTGAFLIAIVAAITYRLLEPRDSRGKRIHLPTSQLDWIVQAARKGAPQSESRLMSAHKAFAKHLHDFAYAVLVSPRGQVITRIVSPPEQENLSWLGWSMPKST
jgi:hypothetical protein